MEDIIVFAIVAIAFVYVMVLPHYWHKKSVTYRGESNE